MRKHNQEIALPVPLKYLSKYLFIAITIVSTTIWSQNPKLDSIVQAEIKKGFSGKVLIAKNGETIYEKEQQKDQSSRHAKNTAIYPIASITKWVTCILTFQLIEEGKLTLETGFSHKDIPIIPPSYGSITIAQLLLHTSGLPKEEDSIFTKRRTPRELLYHSFSNKPKEEKKFLYKNTDYILLGLILEKITGKTYQQLLKDRISVPLQLDNTELITSSESYNYFPKPLEKNGEPYAAVGSSFYLENYYSAGSIYSSAEDLIKIDQALRRGNLLSKQAQATMGTAFPEYNYSGYGVWTYKYPFAYTTPRIMERRGSIMGYNTVIVRFLDKDLTLIILSNSAFFNPSTFGDKQNLKEALLIAVDAL
jgi:CubicO group peptidase (beta-lactamase class C family)